MMHINTPQPIGLFFWVCVVLVLSVIAKNSNIRRTQNHNLNDSRLIMQLPLPNPLKPDGKSRMEM